VGGARAALEQALQFNPASPEARALLSEILGPVREGNVGVK
jgi:hypothetical protein